MRNSIHTLKSTVTDYQISLLLCLKQGSQIVTNEGSNFRAWLETNGTENKKVSVRKDVACNLLSLGLIGGREGKFRHLYYYGLSAKGDELLGRLDQTRIAVAVRKLSDKGVFKDT